MRLLEQDPVLPQHRRERRRLRLCAALGPAPQALENGGKKGKLGDIGNNQGKNGGKTEHVHEKRKGWEEIMNLLSLLSKHFNIAGAFFSYSTFERQLSHEKSGTSNIYVGRQTWGKISVHVFLPVNTILNI